MIAFNINNEHLDVQVWHVEVVIRLRNGIEAEQLIREEGEQLTFASLTDNGQALVDVALAGVGIHRNDIDGVDEVDHLNILETNDAVRVEVVTIYKPKPLK